MSGAWSRGPACAALLLFIAAAAAAAAGARGPERDGVVFPEKTALQAVALAFSAYCSGSALSSWSCGDTCNMVPSFRFVGTVFDSASDTFGYVGYYDDTIVIAFRGSQSLKNFIYDLQFAKQETYPNVQGAKVHTGFMKCYDAVQDQVRAQLLAAAAACPLCHSVLVTGHSLGGALAVLCSIDQTLPAHMTPVLYTFGCPRVGNAPFAEFVTSRIQHWRVVHERDIVPHLPPRAIGFQHTAREIWQHNNAYIVCDNSGEDPDCSDSVLATSVADHLTYMNVAHNCSEPSYLFARQQ